MKELTMKLKPPLGYNSWLDYAIQTMDTRTLHIGSCDESQWGRVLQGEEMRREAKKELSALRKVAKEFWPKNKPEHGKWHKII